MFEECSKQNNNWKVLPNNLTFFSFNSTKSERTKEFHVNTNMLTTGLFIPCKNGFKNIALSTFGSLTCKSVEYLNIENKHDILFARQRFRGCLFKFLY